jgi:acyl carrier protein
MAESIEGTIKEMIVERLFLDVKPEEIDETKSLFDEYGVDSVAVLEIVVGLEETYGLSFADEDFSPQMFETVKSIADYVRSKSPTRQDRHGDGATDDSGKAT